MSIKMNSSINEKPDTELPLVDQNAYRVSFGGDEVPKAAEVYVRCAERVLNSLPQRISDLKDAVKNENKTLVSDIAHQLKGSLLTVGGKRLGAFCFYLETNAVHLTFPEISGKLNEIENILPSFEVEIKAFMKQLRLTGPR